MGWLLKCQLCKAALIFDPVGFHWDCLKCKRYSVFIGDDAVANYQKSSLSLDEHEPCHCGHSHYDHIGWRMQNGEYDHSNCRIIRCNCEQYHTAAWSCSTNHHPEES